MFVSLNDIRTNRSEFNYRHPTNLPQTFIDNLNLEAVYQYIEKNNFKNKELFSLYYHLYLMYKHFDDEAYFFRMKELLYKNIDKLNKYGKMNFLLRMVSYCNVKIKRGITEKFESIRLELYEKYIKYELYKTNQNYFRSDVFLNLFIVYIRNHNIAKANSFLEDNIKSVNPAQSKNLIPLCKALILFEEGKFNESLEISSKIKSNMVSIKIQLRKLILKLDYEINDFDGNKDAANNFRHFIMNSKILNESNKNNMLEFVKNYNDLIKLKIYDKDDYLKQQLKKNIENISEIMDKKWFIKKMEFMN